MTNDMFKQAINLKKKIAAAEELLHLVDNAGSVIIKKMPGNGKEINLADISLKIDDIVNDTIFNLVSDELDELYKQFREL